MELTYYSYYPYKDPEFRRTKEGNNDLCVQPFRLYKAATCKALTEFDSEEAFVEACYEAMDCPEYRIENYKKRHSYKDTEYDIEVIPTEHFYGATNSDDGVFYFPESGRSYIFTMLDDGPVIKDTWFDAVLSIFRKHQSSYLTNLCDFTQDR